MKKSTKTLVAGKYLVTANNGKVRLHNTGTGKHENFAEGWPAEGLRHQLRINGTPLPSVGEYLETERDLVVEQRMKAFA